MVAKRKKFTGVPSGRSYTTITLKKGMPAEFANTQILLVQDTPAVVWYDWDVGEDATEFEPPSLPIFEVVAIRIRFTCNWVDDKGNFYCKTYKNTDIVHMFSEETLQTLDNRVMMMLKEDADNDFDIPEEY